MKIKNMFCLSLFIFGLLIFSATCRAQNTPRTVKIYLPRYDAANNSESFQTIERKVNAAAPLRPTLEFLFAPRITADEERQGFGSATFGMRFEGVELKSGTALVKFSQPPDETNYGSLGADTLTVAIEKIARQFAAVKRVKICAVGATQIDSELETPFPRCPKAK